jgi:hypothetical protein
MTRKRKFNPRMRLLRDRKPIKRMESFSFRIGTEFRKMTHVFKQFRRIMLRRSVQHAAVFHGI